MPLAEADRSGAPSSHARGLSGSFASHWLPWLRVWMTQMTSRSMAQRSLAPERQPKAHGPGGVLGQPGVTDQPRPSSWTGRSHADAARDRWAVRRRRAHKPTRVGFLIIREGNRSSLRVPGGRSNRFSVRGHGAVAANEVVGAAVVDECARAVSLVSGRDLVPLRGGRLGDGCLLLVPAGRWGHGAVAADHVARTAVVD